MSFLDSITNNSKKFDDPFVHWELNKPLTAEQINEIYKSKTSGIALTFFDFRKDLSFFGKNVLKKIKRF